MVHTYNTIDSHHITLTEYQFLFLNIGDPCTGLVFKKPFPLNRKANLQKETTVEIGAIATRNVLGRTAVWL